MVCFRSWKEGAVAQLMEACLEKSLVTLYPINGRPTRSVNTNPSILPGDPAVFASPRIRAAGGAEQTHCWQGDGSPRALGLRCAQREPPIAIPRKSPADSRCSASRSTSAQLSPSSALFNPDESAEVRTADHRGCRWKPNSWSVFQVRTPAARVDRQAGQVWLRSRMKYLEPHRQASRPVIDRHAQPAAILRPHDLGLALSPVVWRQLIEGDRRRVPTLRKVPPRTPEGRGATCPAPRAALVVEQLFPHRRALSCSGSGRERLHREQRQFVAPPRS